MLGSGAAEQEMPHQNDVDRGDAAKCRKREDYLEWSEYFMAVAFLSAQRSKDPNSQVGACIVNSENKIVGIGYNGMPNRCSDDSLPWARTAKNKLDTKYMYVCHAELNAILNKNASDVKGCTMYVALFPCNECAKLIIQSGISKVTYMSDKYQDLPEMKASRLMLNMAGVECSSRLGNRSQVRASVRLLSSALSIRGRLMWRNKNSKPQNPIIKPLRCLPIYSKE